MELQFDTSKPVAVTGANGYIAGWVIKYLLDAGVTVHATVRNGDDTAKTAPLMELADNSPGEIRFFSADLLHPGCFDAAIDGCGIVFHTASPYTLNTRDDPHETFVKPAVDGTRNVLESVNRCESVTRVVLTSSCAAIYGDAIDSQNDRGGLTEEDWNTSSSATHNAYSYSKTLAEQAAWEMAGAQDRWKLVVINPSGVFGPGVTSKTASGSYEIIDRLVGGEMRMGAPRIAIGAVDVREVALAHIRAAYLPEAEGRHILSGHNTDFVEMGQILAREYGDRFPLPNRALPKWLVWLVGPVIGISRDFVNRNIDVPMSLINTKSKEALGIEYRPLEESLLEMFEDGIANGHFKSKTG